MEQDELDQAIDIALEGAPRAEQLTAMLDALKERRAGFVRELRNETDPARRRAIQARIAELDRQITDLSEQRAISHFVEMSVRATAARPIHTEAGEAIEQDED